MEDSVTENQVMKKMARSLLPLLVVMFVIAFIDRQNVSFAKLEMLHALGFSEASYGLGASLFFIGYLIFEVPSTLALHRFGARKWLARIMSTWGAITLLLAFTHSVGLFYIYRFALGVAEAGFYPGVIYYLTQWFPPSYRTRVLGYFTLGSVLANMLGALACGQLLSMDGVRNLAGWQWVFLGTGLPAVAIAVIALVYLPDSVSEASFLTAQEKAIALVALHRESEPKAESNNPWAAFVDARVLGFAAVYMLMSTSLYGVTYWLPTLVKSYGVSSNVNGLLNMIPWGLAVLLLLWLPGKLKGEQIVLRSIVVVGAVSAICFLGSTLLPATTLRFVALCLGGACIPLLYPCFWTLPAKYFSGTRAAASIAAINSIGNLGGFLGQNSMPFVSKLFVSQSAPMLVPTACLLTLSIGSGIVAWIRVANPQG